MLFNRLKILLILLVLLFLSVLFWQNRELLSLKLLCPDVNESCLYQTPELPLALWMLIFTLAGVITSLIWQLLNHFSTKESNILRPETRETAATSSSKSKSSSSNRYFSEAENLPRGSQKETKFTNTEPRERSSVETKTRVNTRSTDNFSEGSDWEDDSRNDDWNIEESNQQKVADQTTNKGIKDNKSYKLPKDFSTNQSPDTTYSYKSRPGNKSQDQKVDRVYDANYRVINPSLQKTTKDQIDTRQDDDEEWI